ncbi:unnamed protein product [Vitrella brassicaformis CCMP3155]|uniref:Uncharacterized protein n=2 Tax=Vitrella brassicaformis TaxID=1169539 RepID=A0A0G4EW18_VITBC|nr:unnamed protein product [Vitrella brassicaformis CCMP3155]|eukprot:CEM02525.1 unnamed protein product [Vitrella brassicaformis CCMP3155]
MQPPYSVSSNAPFPAHAAYGQSQASRPPMYPAAGRPLLTASQGGIAANKAAEGGHGLPLTLSHGATPIATTGARRSGTGPHPSSYMMHPMRPAAGAINMPGGFMPTAAAQIMQPTPLSYQPQHMRLQGTTGTTAAVAATNMQRGAMIMQGPHTGVKLITAEGGGSVGVSAGGLIGGYGQGVGGVSGIGVAAANKGVGGTAGGTKQYDGKKAAKFEEMEDDIGQIVSGMERLSAIEIAKAKEQKEAREEINALVEKLKGKVGDMKLAAAAAPPPSVAQPNISITKLSNTSGPKPPFYWVPSTDYVDEFAITGAHHEVVTKVRDFEDQGWVIPVSGTLRISRGAFYKWSFSILKKCAHRPQLQFGVHGMNHEKPWRLITTSRCSRSRDDEPWQDRPGGDRLIDEGNVVHVEVDMRPLNGKEFGSLSYAVNDEEWEVAFEDLPLDETLLMPIVSMGGDGCSVKLLNNY